MFRAGAAASNVTPPLGLPIVGGFSPSPATHIHDELYAKCVVLDDGETRLALVIVDNIGMAREVGDAAKQMIQEHTGIRPENVMTAGTHTHSSISARGANRLVRDDPLGDYQQFLAMRIADGVRRAVNNLEPARIGWGSVQVPAEVFNRRYYMKPGTPTPNPFGGEDQVVMNPGSGNPNILKAAGPTDPEVAFLSIQSTDGRPIALVANYSLHYVGPGAGWVISADYFGVFGDRIQQLLGADRLAPPFVGIMSNGTSGDINNVNWLEKSEKTWQPYEKMRQVAEVVAQAVYEAHQKMEFHDWVRLAVAQEELALAVRKPSDEQLAYAREVLAKPEEAKPYHPLEKTYAGRVLELHESPGDIKVLLQAFCIGDLGICALPFEVFVEIGLRIKAESPLGQTFVISHANGTYGYLPTVEQHALGGYETWLGTNTVEIEAAPKMIDRLIVMLSSLK
ncbi:MAG: hypothetical protein A2V98_03365 [Planctomycetes bacterium RBG_16_64_12]|nr:MAG: hypothetical protein A2V98_03365 [Planctomycetes bacterium RBG_16_64_12]